MELNNKEKKIKQVLSDVNYDIDTDFLWKDVSKELDKKKKRRFLWFIPLFLLVGFGFSYIFLNYKISPSNKLSDSSNLESSESLSKIEKDNTLTQDQKSNVQLAKDQLEKDQLAKAYSIQSNENNFKNNYSSPNTKQSIRLAEYNYNSKTSASIGSLFAPESFSGPSEKVSPSSNLNIGRPSVFEEQEKSVFSEMKVGSNIKSLFEINKVGLTAFDLMRANETIEDEKFAPIEIKDLTSKRIFLAFGAGVINNITTKNTIDGEFSNEYFEKQTELLGVNASALIGIQTKNNWKFFGGFDYAQLVTRFQNNDLEIIDGSVPIDDQQIIDAQNSYQSTEGVLATQSKIENDITWHQYHNLYNIQLGVSKDLIKSSKFSLGPEISLMQNIYSSHSGYFFSQDYPYLTKFNGKDQSPFRSNTGISSQLGLNLAYRIRGIEFSLHSAWRNPLNTITKESNFYQTKNSQLSTQVRVNYLLNWENK